MKIGKKNKWKWDERAFLGLVFGIVMKIVTEFDLIRSVFQIRRDISALMESKPWYNKKKYQFLYLITRIGEAL